MLTELRLKITLFQFCKMLGLFRLSHYLMRDRLLILGYHGFQLTDEASFRPSLFMRSQVFERRLATLERYRCRVIPLAEAVECLPRGELPNNAVVITIDDGFVSVLDESAPLLQQYGFPSTLYVTSYYANKGTPIFRLAVQYMFWKTSVDSVDLSQFDWAPSGAVDLHNVEAKDRVCRSIIDYGESGLDEEGRQHICYELGDSLGLDYAEIARSRRLSLLGVDELKRLKDFAMDVQLHTHRHHFPDGEDAERELSENRTYLRQVVVSSLEHFCYPNGLWHRSLWSVLEAACVKSATTCDAGLNDRHTALMGLYRVLDRDDLMDIEFEAEVSGFVELTCIARRMGKVNNERRI